MPTSITVPKLVAWLSAFIDTEIAEGATPSTVANDLLQRCLDSAVIEIQSTCTLPVIYTADIEQAILMTAAKNWDRRKSASGVADFGAFGAVRVSVRDADIESKLAPYRKYRFS